MKNALTYVLTALVLLACVVRIATAEEVEYWTANEDLYYHSYADCLGESGRVPISGTAADSFGKAMCPLCAEADDTSTEIAAATVRNMMIVRLPEGWIRQNTDDSFQPVQHDTLPIDFRGVEIQRKLAQYFHGEEYARAMRDFAAGSLDTHATRILLEYDDGSWEDDMQRLLCERRLNGARYYLFFMNWSEESEAEEPLPEKLDLDEIHLWAEDGALMQRWYRGLSDGVHTVLSLDRGGEAEFTADYNGTSLTVYPALGAHIALFNLASGEDTIWSADLRINGFETGVWMNGNWDSDTQSRSYWCLLSDAELAALRNGAAAELAFQKMGD